MQCMLLGGVGSGWLWHEFFHIHYRTLDIDLNYEYYTHNHKLVLINSHLLCNDKIKLDTVIYMDNIVKMEIRNVAFRY